jgi:hypothetical protein
LHLLRNLRAKDRGSCKHCHNDRAGERYHDSRIESLVVDSIVDVKRQYSVCQESLVLRDGNGKEGSFEIVKILIWIAGD